MMTLQELLEQDGVIIADGATGTTLQAAGLPAGTPPELWDLERPEIIRELHRSYIEAGAQLILTNTFGGSRPRLEKAGLGDKVQEINRAAARLAKEVAGEQALVLGDIGPSGEMMAPLGTLTVEEARRAFAEQAAALAEGGADAILVETMSDLGEARAAVEGAREATALPILCTMSFDTHGRTMMGVRPEQAVAELWPLGLAAVGANCGRTLSENLEAIRAMRQALPEAVLMAKPNAGLPHLDGGDLVYDVTPEVMAEYAVRFAEQGVKILGGCCGSTPAHIAAIAAALRPGGV
jgi:5-methyltetrahydrofolate--homocysteine methyltransferase